MVPQAYYYMYSYVDHYNEFWSQYELLDNTLHRILDTYKEAPPVNYGIWLEIEETPF